MALFTKTEPQSVTYGLGIEEHDHEGRVITADYGEFYLVTVYTPNSQNELKRLDYRMTWEDAFREYLVKLDAEKPVIVCGDCLLYTSSMYRIGGRLGSKRASVYGANLGIPLLGYWDSNLRP